MSRLSGTSVATTWNPVSTADGDEVAVDVTVPGAKLGDMVFVSPEVDVVDATVSATVTAANTVTIVLANNTGVAVNLDSATWNVRVVPKDSFF